MTIIHESGPPISLDQIDRTTSSYRIILPADYRLFLSNHNGGRPAPNEIRVHRRTKGRQECRRVDYILSLSDAIETRTELLQDANLDERMLPVAVCEDGDYILLSMRGDDAGSVYYWVNVEGDYMMASEHNQVEPIATAWQEFMNELGT